MDRTACPALPGFPGWCHRAVGLGTAGLLLLGSARGQPPTGRSAGVPVSQLSPAAVAPATLPAPQALHGHAAPSVADAAPKLVPITLDTVLRLAEGQNAQISLARARVDEAYAQRDLASAGWLPNVYFGTAYYRHEGGIANEDGTLTHSSFSTLFGGAELSSKLDLKEFAYQKVNAERGVWQQRGELSRISSETLLDAANTYIDLLAARTGEGVALALQNDLEKVRDRARRALPALPETQVEYRRVEAQARVVERSLVNFRQQAARASAKLVYLLGVNPCVTLVPADEQLVPLELVDVSAPVCDLVAQVLANGPGIQEMEGLLALVQESMRRAEGPGKYLPVFETRMSEGGFGTGPGDRQDWDNRWDLGIQARWNLTNLLTRGERQRILQAKSAQAQLAYRDLREKLTASVQESREVILGEHEQIRLSREQIQEARKAFDLSWDRLQNAVGGSSASEVQLSLQSFAEAQVDYLQALRELDKAEVRLMILLGWASSHAPAGTNCPGGCRRAQ
jgi:outer membrane protein TolC